MNENYRGPGYGSNYCLTINEYFEREKYKRTHFSCHYIQGICTVKVSWKNCSGGKPYDLCEKALNGLP